MDAASSNLLVIAPLDSTLLPNSDYNSAFILQRFGPARISPWPDQELVSRVVQRVQLRAQMPLRVIMLPHFVSLPLDFTSEDKEVNGFVVRGRYQRTLGLPFLPFRAMGQGAVSPRHFRHRPNWRKPDFEATAPIGPATRD
jgi:hypothetical protein